MNVIARAPPKWAIKHSRDASLVAGLVRPSPVFGERSEQVMRLPRAAYGRNVESPTVQVSRFHRSRRGLERNFSSYVRRLAVVNAVELGIAAALAAIVISASATTVAASATSTGGPGLHPSSEIVSTALVQHQDGTPNSNSLSRVAVTLNTARADVQMLTSQGSAFECWQGYSPSDGPCQVTVNGVSYNRTENSNQWTGEKLPNASPAELSPSYPMNSLATFKEVALGAVTRLRDATIAGIATSEYRAQVSLVKLYLSGVEGNPDLLSVVYVMANPSPGSPYLSAPVTVWATAAGELLQVESSQTRAIPGDSIQGSGQSDLVTDTATITLSNFGIAVHAVAPPASDVTYRSLPKPTRIEGIVIARESDGQVLHQPGLLVLGLRRQFVGEPTSSSSIDQFALVSSKGSFSATVLSTSNTPGKSLQIAATFYPAATTVLHCVTLDSQHFSTGTTTSNVELEC